MYSYLQAPLWKLLLVSLTLTLSAFATLPYTFPPPPEWSQTDYPQSNRTDWISPDKSTIITITHCEIVPMNAKAFWTFFSEELKKTGITILSSHPLGSRELEAANCEEGYEAILLGSLKGGDTKTLIRVLVKESKRVFLVSATSKGIHFDMLQEILGQTLGNFRAI